MDGGTLLARPRDVPGPPGPIDAWRGRRNSFLMEEAQAMPVWMMVTGAAVQAAMLTILALAGLEPWRLIGTGAVYVAFLAMQKVVTRNVRSEGSVEAGFVAIGIGAQLFTVTTAALTGGVHSPFIPTIVVPAIVSLLFFGPIAASRWLAVANGLLVLAMIALPGWITGGPLPEAHYTAGLMLATAWSVVLLHAMAGKLARAAARAGETYACLREERVAEAEAQLRRLQSVGAKVAHELKNPLAAIKGLCQLVARTPESERTQERLAVVAAEIGRMETILSEYLSFSRPLEDLAPEALDLALVARDVVQVLAGRADSANVQLAVEGGSTPAKGDPRRLKEALMNLVANAIEATPSGGRVVLRVRATGSGAVTVAVEDTGRGIAPDVLERLGTSFFTTRPNGTGLGVVLAQGVIAQHGGTLTYTSAIGQGTTALVTLPAAADATPEPGARAAMIEARA